MSFLMPKLPTQRIEGQRLDNLTVTSSAYGEAINVGAGTIRIPGNVIWATELEEEKRVTTSTSGGKGGGGQKTVQTDWFYYANMAIGFAAGPARKVIRQWADGQTFYDNSAETPQFELDGLQFRFYPGSEQQEPDPLILADKGAANTPAYRGLVYIVFERLPLNEFGNRIPNITAEINFELAQPIGFDMETGPEAPDAGTREAAMVDWRRGRVYIQESYPARSDYLMVFDLATMAFIEKQSLIFESFAESGMEFNGLDEWTGYLVGGALNGDVGSKYNYVYDPFSASVITLDQLTGTEESEGKSLEFSPASVIITNVNVFPPVAALIARDLSRPQFGDTLHYVFFTFPGLVFQRFIQNDGSLWTRGRTLEINGAFGEAFAVWFFETRADVMRFSVDANGNVAEERVGTFTNTDVDPAGALFGAPFRDLSYDSATGGLVFAVNMSDGDDFVVKWVPGSGVVWATEVALGSIASSPDNDLTVRNTRLNGGAIVYAPSGTMYSLDLLSGDLSEISVGTFLGFRFSWWDDLANCYYTIQPGASGFPEIERRCFTGMAAADTTLQLVTERVAVRGQIDPVLDIDASALGAIGLGGYMLDDTSDAADALIDLMDVYTVSILEADGKITFLLRGGASLANLDEADFVVEERRRQPYRRDIEEEIDLPEAVVVGFLNRALDYQQDQRGTTRTLIPDPTVYTRQTEEIEVSAVIPAATAKGQSEILLYSRWAEAEQIRARLPTEHMKLVPGDPVTIALDNGYSTRARIDRADLGADWSIQAEMRSETRDQYTADVVTGEGAILQSSTPTLLASRLFIWSGPLLRDIDATDRQASRGYAAASSLGLAANHPGTELYRSLDDGASYELLTRLLNAAPWGAAQTALADPADWFRWDDDNVLDVRMAVGGDELETRPDLDVLNGANAGILFKRDGTLEYLQWANHTALGDGVHRLSRLLRGRRGTDTQAPGHTTGELFLVVTRAFVEGLQRELAEIGTDFLYKPVTVGALLEETVQEAFADDGADLKPYEPVHVVAEEQSGDIVWTWVRRTRVGGALRDSVDAPLSEDSEEYNLRIFADADAATPLRTFNVSAETATYLNADIVSDFGAVPATIWYELAQVSAQVGDGFFRRREIEVT